jgi:two-component system chemotaxis response regulator CheY
MSFDFSMPVLVVEDFSTMGRINCGLLRQIGFQHVDLAHGGTTALGKMRDTRYGLVISDWNMQPMTGLDLLKQIRLDNALAHTTIRMCPSPTIKLNVTRA